MQDRLDVVRDRIDVAYVDNRVGKITKESCGRKMPAWPLEEQQVKPALDDVENVGARP